MTKGGAEEEPATLSPKSRLKFLCSYGGKILPRPSDGQLKYVGGETRILSVPRSITFRGLKEKISGMFNNPDIVIKYQVFPEDLDALVSVRSDEDLHHMLDEYDRHEGLPRSPSSASRFRIFLFRSGIALSPSTSPTYLDAVNGGSLSARGSFSIPIPSKPPMFAVSSPSVCSSPDSSPHNGSGLLTPSVRPGRPGMSRVRSTPNLSAASLSQMAAVGGSCSTAGSPKGGGVVGGFCAPQYNHHYHQYHQQLQPMQQHKGMMMGYAGGGMSRMGCGPYRQEMCGYECGPVFSGHHNQRRCYYAPSAPSAGGSVWGQMDDSHTPKTSSSHSSFNFSGAGTPPVVPKRSIWE